MAYQLRGLSQTNRDMVAAIGVIAAGAAVFEAALIPGIVIGGAAVLAPKVLPTLRRCLPPLFNATVRRRIEPADPLPARPEVKLPLAAPPRLAIKQAVAKTITFRIIITAVDLTANYVVIGELAAAAGLSTVSLVVNPFFYFAHETACNYFGPSFMRKFREWGTAVHSPILPPLDPRQRRHRPAAMGLRSIAPWPRRSLFAFSPRRWTLPRTIRAPRSHHGGEADCHRLRGRPFCVFRPREGLGVFWFARSARETRLECSGGRAKAARRSEHRPRVRHGERIMRAPEENDSVRPRRERNPISIGAAHLKDLTVSKIARCQPPVHEDRSGSQTNDLSFGSALHALRQLDTI